DAGGYFGTDRWGTTSGGGGGACPMAGEFGGRAAHLMPGSYNWPYQSLNYEAGAAAGGRDDSPALNGKPAWGAHFGFLGQTAYPIHGSSLVGGPLSGDPTASAYPRKSYSTFIVLGLQSSAPVTAQVNQVEHVQPTVFTAATGTVATSGP